MGIKVKVCGLTNLDDAQFALDSGANMLGFVLYPRSPRFVMEDKLKSIIENLSTKGKDILKVGVFVNETIENMLQVYHNCHLDALQLHGDEVPEMLGVDMNSREEDSLAGFAYKAIKPPTLELAKMQARRYGLPEDLRMNGMLPAFLVDTYHPEKKGGTGTTGDWELCAELARSYPILLAGGLNPNNVLEAIQQVHPWGIDVSSGVESSPGKKDFSLLTSFFKKVKQ